MIPFVGVTHSRDFVAMLAERRIGRIGQRGQLRGMKWRYHGERWALDNGAFQDWINGREFDDDAYASDVAMVKESGALPWLAVLPDVPGDANATAKAADAWRPRLPEWPWYLALQDGVKPCDVRALSRDLGLRGLFIGGTDAFKLSAAMWADLAHDLGISCHYGRASTPRKMKWARAAGCDSFDTSFPLWTRARFEEFLRLTDLGYRDEQNTFAWSESEHENTAL